MTRIVIDLETLGAEQAAWIVQAAAEQNADGLGAYATTLLGEVITRQMTRPTQEQMQQSAKGYAAWHASRPPADLLDEASFEEANGIGLAKGLRRQAAEHAGRQQTTATASTAVGGDPPEAGALYRQWLRGCTDEGITRMLATKIDAAADLPDLLDEARHRGLASPPEPPAVADAGGVVLIRPGGHKPIVLVSLREWATIREGEATG